MRDKSWTIRRLAVQAVAAAAEVGAAAQIAPLCSDREVPVRCAAFDALAALGSELVLAPAREALAEEAWQVRASAIEALGRVRHRDSIAPLIERLKSEQGRLKADVAAALEALTARGLGQRVELWERFWNSYKDRYQIPTDEELALLRQRQAERSQEYEPSAGSVTFHGVDSPSRKLLFVIDVSGSMENEVVEKERFEEGEYPSFSRMEIVKTELARTIANLESYVEFNILAFATEVKAWKKRPVKANVLSKSSAATFIKRLEPIGGASRQDLARVGLVGAASLGAGKTNTYAALSQALELDRGAQDEYRTSVDTIFFFSDGKPTHGRFIDTSEILTQVREGNALRRVVIHAIALGQFDKTFMERLALENNGVFVDLGK